MMLIFNLTHDNVQYDDNSVILRANKSKHPIRSEQILTEHGLFYVANNILASNLSAM